MYSFQSNLSGSHVLVTGGKKGIGHATVEAYLAEGANVSYCSRSTRGDEFSLFKAADTARAVGSAVDIENPAEIQDWVSKAYREFGKIDVVVANASPILQEPTPENWQRAFQADIMGLVALIEASLPHLAERARAGGHPSIVVLSSLAGFEARHRVVAGPYTTLKRAQATLAKDYWRKLAPLGVRINCVVPAMIETPGFTHPDGTEEPNKFQGVKEADPAYFKELMEATPMKRTGSSAEAATVIVFLSSPLASYVCGASIMVDGGLSTFF